MIDLYTSETPNGWNVFFRYFPERAVQKGRAAPPVDLGAQNEKTLEGGRKLLV